MLIRRVAVPAVRVRVRAPTCRKGDRLKLLYVNTSLTTKR